MCPGTLAGYQPDVYLCMICIWQRTLKMPTNNKKSKMATHILSHRQIHIPGAAYMHGHFNCIFPMTIELIDADRNK
jgi:hypothetical protein